MTVISQRRWFDFGKKRTFPEFFFFLGFGIYIYFPSLRSHSNSNFPSTYVAFGNLFFFYFFIFRVNFGNFH